MRENGPSRSWRERKHSLEKRSEWRFGTKKRDMLSMFFPEMCFVILSIHLFYNRVRERVPSAEKKAGKLDNDKKTNWEKKLRDGGVV